MCVGCREGFREVVGGGLADLSVFIVSFPRLTLAVPVVWTVENTCYLKRDP